MRYKVIHRKDSIFRLSVCKRYPIGARFNRETKTYQMDSLPQLEGISKHVMSKNYFPWIPYSNHKQCKKNIYCAKGSFEAIKSSIYRYVVDVHISLSVGEFAEDIFNSARELVDVFLRKNCPDASKQLLSIQTRMNESDTESNAQALISCRRILSNVADSIFPPQTSKYNCRDGTERKIEKEEYKNRLLAYIDKNIQSDTTLCILQDELSHLAARLDSVYEKTNKGIHDMVSREEAELTIIHMYLFLAKLQG